ncbi:MAG: hypothetical protein H7Y60_02390 [Rhodospirillaceae bacterium]|nr:hypothetical protein [Rhodospirillales bacterium]
MDHDILTLDWNAQTLLVLSRQLVKEVLDWAHPNTAYAQDRHLSRDYACDAADIGYAIGIIETRLDRELGIWINLRRTMNVAEILDGDVAGLTQQLHRVLVAHFQLSLKSA